MSIINVELFDETVSLLKALGHHVYIGLDQCSSYFKNYIEACNKKNEISGLDPYVACCHRRSEHGLSFCYIYLQSEEDWCKAMLWHEAWHALQFCHDPNKNQFWFVDGECSAVPQDMLKEGIAEFNNAVQDVDCLWSANSFSAEIPAIAVENHPQFVVSVLKSFVDKIEDHKVKQRGLYELIGMKAPRSSYRYDRLTCISGENILDDWLVYKNGDSKTAITLVEFCRQNGFIIPKHLL